jgi:hypothetical protein
MKKKLNLTSLKVQSFVTAAEAGTIRGGAATLGACLLRTKFSCLDYISCNPADCIPIE